MGSRVRGVKGCKLTKVRKGWQLNASKAKKNLKHKLEGRNILVIHRPAHCTHNFVEDQPTKTSEVFDELGKIATPARNILRCGRESGAKKVETALGDPVLCDQLAQVHNSPKCDEKSNQMDANKVETPLGAPLGSPPPASIFHSLKEG